MGGGGASWGEPSAAGVGSQPCHSTVAPAGEGAACQRALKTAPLTEEVAEL